ncbi:MAG: hypothetical protein JKY20_04600 [Alphaproteobacteria bacterium]|nr:hypothetical protein [Alphaproteobacteria bacterium]
MENVQSVSKATVETLTVDLRTVTTAYCECRRAGERDYKALLAAIRAYRASHPALSANDATYAVSQLMRNLDRDALAS